MVAVFDDVMNRLNRSDREDVRASQRHWLKERLDCGDDFICTKEAYTQRIERLNSVLAKIRDGGNTQEAICVVSDPNPPLNVRTAPNGSIVGTLVNNTMVVVLYTNPDRSWAFVGRAENRSPIGWAFRRYLDCKGIGAGSSANNERQPSSSTDVYGTGFFVSRTGHVLTNYHVVKDCRTFKISSESVASADAYLITSDSTNDLALLNTRLTPVLVPALNSRAKVGDNIFVFGFPLMGLLATSGNFTAGNITATAGLTDNTSMFQISAPVQPGNSGGPLIDQLGNVVGVVESKLDAIKVAKITEDIPQNVNFAIKATIAINFLESHGVDPATESSKRRLEPSQIAEAANKFSVRLSCR
jgi:S1-C subfamily serine protease